MPLRKDFVARYGTREGDSNYSSRHDLTQDGASTPEAIQAWILARVTALSPSWPGNNWAVPDSTASSITIGSLGSPSRSAHLVGSATYTGEFMNGI